MLSDQLMSQLSVPDTLWVEVADLPLKVPVRRVPPAAYKRLNGASTVGLPAPGPAFALKLPVRRVPPASHSRERAAMPHVITKVVPFGTASVSAVNTNRPRPPTREYPVMSEDCLRRAPLVKLMMRPLK